MGSIQTKFDVGDSVFHATIITETRSHPCPDCLGTRKWKATSPAGGEFETGCPRCSQSYQANRALNLQFAWWVPRLQKLTIGSIQANSEPDNGDWGTGNRYMCLETGVGSGNVYRESELFLTEEEAMAYGEAKAAVNNADAAGWVAKQYEGSLKFSDYELKDASIESANDLRRSLQVRVGMLLDDIEDAEDADDIKRTVKRWREGDDQ